MNETIETIVAFYIYMQSNENKYVTQNHIAYMSPSVLCTHIIHLLISKIKVLSEAIFGLITVTVENMNIAGIQCVRCDDPNEQTHPRI